MPEKNQQKKNPPRRIYRRREPHHPASKPTAVFDNAQSSIHESTREFTEKTIEYFHGMKDVTPWVFQEN
mgnify:CR=1 FL=1